TRDFLAQICEAPTRPSLVVGFPRGGSAADRHQLLGSGSGLRRSSPLPRKHCDFLSAVVAVCRRWTVEFVGRRKMRVRPHGFMRDDPIGCTSYDVVAFTGSLLEPRPVDFDQAPPSGSDGT